MLGEISISPNGFYRFDSTKVPSGVESESALHQMKNHAGRRGGGGKGIELNEAISQRTQTRQATCDSF